MVERDKNMLGKIKDWLKKVFKNRKDFVRLTRAERRKIWKKTWEKTKGKECD